MSGPCTCFTSMYVQILPVAHAFAVIWMFVCTVCRPSLTSYGVSYFSNFPFFYGVLHLWAGLYPMVGFSLFQPTLLILSAVLLFLLPFLLWCCLTLAYWASLGLLLILLSMIQYGHLGFALHCLWVLLSHLFPSGHPWPIYFFWASLALFLTLCSYGFLLTPLGFLSPITLSFILGAYGLAINPLLSLLALLRACCGPFSLFYITFCPWVCHFSLSGLL